jgi:integrase
MQVNSSRMFYAASVPLGIRFLRSAEPDIHLLSRGLEGPSQKIEFVFSPVPKQFVESLGREISFAQSATCRTWQSAHFGHPVEFSSIYRVRSDAESNTFKNVIFTAIIKTTEARTTTLPDLRNPIKEMKRRDRRKRNCKAVDEDILDQLTSGITVLRDKMIFALYLSTGLRLAELQQLNRDSITFDLRVNERGARNILRQWPGNRQRK